MEYLGISRKEYERMGREYDLMNRMMDYYTGDPARIQHFVKVYTFARVIGTGEGLDESTMEILGAAALVHDIGIRIAEEKYGSSAGHLQEQEGPAEADRMLRQAGYTEEVIARVCYLVGHHHTYTNIDGIDYQILVEADFLVNLYEDETGRKGIGNAYRSIFVTETGKRICRTMFAIEDTEGPVL